MIKFDIINSFTGAVQFTTKIKCDEEADRSLKVGMAVKSAIEKGADLQGANLWGADLQGANLRGANLRGVDLWQANMQGADLTGADLQGANLRRANLKGARLKDINIRGANLWGTILWGTDKGDNETAAKAPEHTAVASSDKNGLTIAFYNKNNACTHFLQSSKDAGVYDYELRAANGDFLQRVSSHWPLSEIINACKGL